MLVMQEEHAQHQLVMETSITALMRANSDMYLETHAQIYGYRYSSIDQAPPRPLGARTLATSNFKRFYSKCKPPKVGRDSHL